MGTPGKNSYKGALHALALVTELGFAIGLPIVFGAVVGNWLDKRYGGRGVIFLAVFLLGLASGLYSGYRLLRNAVEHYK